MESDLEKYCKFKRISERSPFPSFLARKNRNWKENRRIEQDCRCVR
jgi:hypothetical protein